MIHKLLILTTVLLLAGCAGKTRTNNTQATEPSATDTTVEVEPLTAEQLAEGVITSEFGIVTATPELLTKIDVARYRQYGLTEIKSLDPFVVGSNEKIVLKDPETANDGLNGIRFEEWGDKEWLNNNYIRSVRLYLDAYNLGLVKDEALDKHKEAIKGKFCICSIEPFVYGGAWVHIAFVDDTSFSLRFWVYSSVNESNTIAIESYDVRSADLVDEPLGITTEEIKEILTQNPHNQLW
ncbi:MAG: hypothetical protein J6V21_00095 [Alistipes sp.]|nr:hypothetical protein [Alistipes sp.]